MSQAHFGVEVGKAGPPSSCPHCRSTGRVQAEKVDTSLVTHADVSAQVELGKFRVPAELRDASRVNAHHSKRNHSDPRVAVEGIDLQRARDQWAQRGGWNGPVGEQQV